MNSRFGASGGSSNLSNVLQSIKKVNTSNDALRQERQRLVYNPSTRRFEQVTPAARPEGALDVTQGDLGWGVGPPSAPRIVISPEQVPFRKAPGFCRRVRATVWDHGDVYAIGGYGHEREETVSASICIMNNAGPGSREAVGYADDQMRVLLRGEECDGNARHAEGSVKIEGAWVRADVQFLPGKDALFSRFGGIIETDALDESRVCIVGIGSIGSGVTVELAKAGVTHFILLDDDRLEPGNVSRHVSPISHTGRCKTKSVADLLRDKNPFIHVVTMEMKADWPTVDALRETVRSSDIVVGGLDNHEGRMVLNRVCLDEGKCLLLPGMRRRAYAGQILVVRPGTGPCYGCLIAASPESVRDQEVSSERQARGLGYTDKAVPVEPGLSNDVAPVVTMTTKLVIQHLLQDRATKLRSLDADLIAPLYLWLNRREQDSPFAALSPMGYGVDEMSVLRWYGLPLKRHPSCPCCGDVAKAGPELHTPSAVSALTGEGE